MPKKLLKGVLIVALLLAGFVCFPADNALAQNTPNLNDQLKIISVKEGSSLAGNLYVSGKSLPNTMILLGLESESKTFAYSVKTFSDSLGNWSASLDQILKSGKYNVVAVEKDKSGLPIGLTKYGPMQIKGSFSFIVQIFSLLVVILLAGFVGGWYINKLAEAKRYRRILLSQRDIVASYSVLKNDVDKALKNLDGNGTEEGKINEMGFLLKRISDNLEKMNKYVVKGVNIIGKYDIISKIYDLFKLKSKT